MIRWTLLALLPTLVIAAATDGESQTLAELDGVEARAREQGPGLDLSSLRRDGGPAAPADAFESRSWYVPPPPPPPAAPARAQPTMPAPPVAPKVPFTFLGQYQEDERLVILLMKGDRMLLVKAGEVIDNTYRVEGIEGRNLVLLYLPLGVHQTLDVDAPG